MRLLLDSNVIIDFLRGRSAAVAFMADTGYRGDDLTSVSIVRTEVFTGMRPREEAGTRAFLDKIQWVDVTVELADEAGELARKWQRSHPGIDTVDFILAAAAERTEAVLCTGNVRHFPMFPGLEPPYR